MGDPRAWVLWATTVLLAASYGRNPLHGIVLLLITLWVHGRASDGARTGGPGVPLRFALAVIPIAAVLNALSAHVGETVLFRLPSWLPLLGGPITLEAIVFGATNGLSLVTILSGFSAFNRAMSVRDLMRLVPRAFHELGVVASIALTFVPQTLLSVERIREAQAVRGHRLKGLRDWVPVVTPLLISGLERGFTLTESMMARGYASVAASGMAPARALLTASLLTSLGGWLALLLVPGVGRIAGVVIALGVAMLGVALWLTGRYRQHTAYRPGRWEVRDSLVVLGCLPILVVLFLRRSMLFYSPYPRLSLPYFDPIAGICALGLLIPGVAARSVVGVDGDDPH